MLPRPTKMNVNRLSQDELAHELAWRGSSKIGTVEEMRKVLRSYIRLEKLGTPITYPTGEMNMEEELRLVEEKLAKLSGSVDELDSAENRASQLESLETKLTHVLGRIDRIKVSDTMDKDRLSGLRNKTEELMSMLDGDKSEDKPAEEVHSVDSSETGEDFSDSESVSNKSFGIRTAPKNCKPVKQKRILSVDKVQSRLHNLSVNASSCDIKSVPVVKWGLKFSGERRDISLNAFLERVDELCDARNVSKEQLFKSAIDLFRGPALNWFRLIRKNVNSWDALKTALREQFLPYDYEDRLWEEIRRRSQGKDETIGIYLAVMDNLFSRLTYPADEKRRLNIILRNLNPFVQEKLCLTEIKSADDLLRVGRQIERSRCFVNSYKPPSRGRDDLEPDLSYIDVESTSHFNRRDRYSAGNSSRNSCTAINANQESSRSAQTRASTVHCWNCGEPGHLAQNCDRPKRLHCYGCGAADVTKFSCRKCNPQGSGNG